MPIRNAFKVGLFYPFLSRKLVLYAKIVPVAFRSSKALSWLEEKRCSYIQKILSIVHDEGTINATSHARAYNNGNINLWRSQNPHKSRGGNDNDFHVD